MATESRKKNSPARVERTLTRAYIVAKVDGDTLTVLNASVEARHQDEAMDKVLAVLPAEQRNVELGAFLARSYRQKKFTAKQEWTTDASESTPSFPNMTRNGAAAG
jgi:hypothetical protein